MRRVFPRAGVRRLAALWCLSLVLVSTSCSFDGSGPGSGARPSPEDAVPDAGSGGGFDGAPAPDPAAPRPDADPGDACRGLCPPPGTCEQTTGTCVFDCGDESGGGGIHGSELDEESTDGDGAECPDVVVCPAGLPCRVRCGGQESCASGIDCSRATSCLIECSGQRSCGAGGSILCGAGACDIRCTSEETCLGGLDCARSCFCSIDCAGESSCSPEAACPEACDDSPGCRSNGPCSNDC